MSDMKASVAETQDGFHVEGYEKIEYDFAFIDNVFDPSKPDLAKCYERWGRCLAVMDMNIFDVYGEQLQAYFDHYKIDLDVHKTMIGEKAKSIDTFLSIVDSMNKFGIYRKVSPQVQFRQVWPFLLTFLAGTGIGDSRWAGY
jgi:3-dehydroquinate synthase